MTPETNPRIDADFPGGNIVVESIDGDDVLLHQDLRDTEGDWFYWYFRVGGAAGRTLRFRFTASPAIGVRGPAMSRDDGRTWCWLGAECVEENGFSHTFAEEDGEVRFSFGMPYLQRKLDAFLSAHADNELLRREVLCRSRAGREVELLRVGRADSQPRCRVLITCRHHCCEMMAGYALEGLLDEVLRGGQGTSWLAENAQILAVPFVDKDGVEEGDQGKNRRPRDHNRDYAGESIYPETAAIRHMAAEWPSGELRLALDLHCPSISGKHNEDIYLVGSPDECIWEQQQRFGEVLESVVQGPLPYRTENNMPFGEAWNTGRSFEQGKSFATWAGEKDGVQMASTIEIPYANAGGEEVNQQTARRFGRDLARALEEYLRQV